jgi:hypothetical protein
MLTMSRRRNWRARVRNVIRSRHYQWLAECRDGDPVPEVVRDVVTDLMHICREQGLAWEQVLAQSRAQFEAEAREAARQN